MTGGHTGWQLALTGGFDLAAADGRQIRVSGKKAKGLLAILALSPGLSASRARLKSLLWSDRGEAQAGDSLRQLLTVLRKELAEQGCDILLVRDDQVGLHTETLRIDTDEIVKLPAQAAAVHYRGPLLNGLDVGDNQFEDWLAAERSTLQAHMIKVLEQLCAENPGEARIATAKRLVGLDTMREASHRALISAYLAMGEKALAKKQLESLALILERELRVKPSDETLSLFAAAETPVQSEPAAIAAARHCAPDLRQPERRCGTAIFQRRHQRRHRHRTLALPRLRGEERTRHAMVVPIPWPGAASSASISW